MKGWKLYRKLRPRWGKIKEKIIWINAWEKLLETPTYPSAAKSLLRSMFNTKEQIAGRMFWESEWQSLERMRIMSKNGRLKPRWANVR